MKLMANDFKTLLSEMDNDLRNDLNLSKRYRINRKLKKNLITTFDTITYERTEFFDKEDKAFVKLLDEKIDINPYERFSDIAMKKLISGATDYSYRITRIEFLN